MAGKDLEKDLLWETPHIAKEAPEQVEAANAFCEGYKVFLNKGKTERECVKEAVAMLTAAGYKEFDETVSYKAGDKVYWNNRGKALVAATFGKLSPEAGIRMNGAHIDSPRLDLKPNPLFEKDDIAYLKPHYYGGIRKYQWTTVPLAMHGIVGTKSGEMIEITIGENEGEPQCCITDLLPHLAADQNGRKLGEGVKGEELNIIIGSLPFMGEEEDKIKNPVKLLAMKLLNEKYGITEKDFTRAEIEMVPAYKAQDIGLDRGLIGAYGQDDRVCAYTSLEAQLNVPMQPYTCCCLLVDKEEIGSVGATGMQSRFFENTVAELMDCMGQYSELKLRRALSSSRMLSSDVSAAFDPLFASCFEKKNSAYFGKGLVFNKYTGSRGKGGSNDANAEYIAAIRAMMEKHDVSFQTAELGKIDVGGGGTIAYISALYGMQVIDSGVAVLNMHAPMEVTSKADVYEAVKGYTAFLLEA